MLLDERQREVRRNELELRQTEGELGGAISAHVRRFSGYERTRSGIIGVEKDIEAHLGPIVIHGGKEKSEPSGTSISELESSLNQLLSRLISGFKEQLAPRKEGVQVAAAPGLLSLATAVKYQCTAIVVESPRSRC